VHRLIDFVNLGASTALGTGESTGTSTRESSTTGEATSTGSTTLGTTSFLVDSSNDGVEDSFDFLLLGFEFFSMSFGVSFDPLKGVINSRFKGGSFFRRELVLDLVVLEGRSNGVAVVFKSVLGFDLLLEDFIFLLVLFSFTDHLFDFVLGKSALVVGNGNLVGFTSGLISSRDVQDTVSIDIEGNFNLRNTSGGRGDTIKVEFTQQVVVLGHGSFTFEDLDEDTRLVISVSGEDLLLLGGDSSVSGDKDSHDTTSSFDTVGKRSDIEQQEVLDGFVTLTGKNGSLDSSTVSNSFIGVDGSVGFLTVEEVSDQLNDLGDSGRTTDQDDVVDEILGDTGVLKNLFDGRNGFLEHGKTEFFELRSSDDAVIILRFVKGVDFDVSLGRRGKNSLSSFTLSSKSSHGSGVFSHIVTSLSLEVSSTKFDKLVIEIFTAQMSITSSGLDFEDTVFDGQEGDIESTTTEIEDEDVSFTLTLSVETVSDSGSSGFVDDTEDVETSDNTGILGGLSLGIIEISGNGNNDVLDSLVKVSFSSFLHLGEDHGGDLFSVEFLGFTLELNADQRLAILTSLDLEGPELDVLLDDGVIELSSDKSLGIEDSVDGVSGNLVLSGITDKTFVFSETDVRGGGSVTLIVGDDFNSIVDPDTDARVGGSEIDTDSSSGLASFRFSHSFE